MLKLPLHPYQEPAVDKFLELGRLLVAYEMGLGKTPIAIACAEELLGCKDIRTCLLVVPASLKYQWAQSLVKFTDLPACAKRVRKAEVTIPAPSGCVIVDGTPRQRQRQLAEAAAERPDYVICSYDTVVSDTRLVKRLRAGLTVLDEASAIKNFGTQRTLMIKRALLTEYRLALTGTPVENKPEEAFSIMEWVDDTVLGPFDLFERAYIERVPGTALVARYKNMHLMNRRLSRAMVRRSRKDPEVARYLPQVDHGQWYCDMDKPTRVYYRKIAADLLEKLMALRGSSGFDMAAYYSGQRYGEATGMGQAMSRQLAIDMLLSHPSLITRSADLYRRSGGAEGSQYCTELEAPPAECPKLDFLMSKMADVLAFPENKVIVFSRWPELQVIIGDLLLKHFGLIPGADSVRYHGGMSAGEKAAAVVRFSAAQCRVFLSSHAGAYGTDMHMANYLINYDLPWSGGMWDQINGRHQRASSEFGKVFVRDILVRDTTEERKLALLRHKLAVAGAVVDGRAPRSGRIDNELESLTDFLLQSV